MSRALRFVVPSGAAYYICWRDYLPQPWGLDVGDLQIGRRERLERVVLRHERCTQVVAGIVHAPSYPRHFVTGVRRS